ncbi:unnamed protein product [Darwinula stevensoni]|uniref:Uncharacterized protein n=1 Tax=Darwinula stevensoni TaxID=69355 RepID=A0A7R9A7F4_9CRUS|nr:unnamed protein product [Darwinula stevensoni]CAG0893123.1 unnamed protein product [Darwinula stevensoni]
MAEQDTLDTRVAQLKIQLEKSFQGLVNLQKQETELVLNHSRANVRNSLYPRVQEKLRQHWLALAKILKEVNETLLELNECSMDPSSMTVMDYIQLRIDAELQEGRPDSKERLQILREAKRQAEIICGTNRPIGQVMEKKGLQQKPSIEKVEEKGQREQYPTPDNVGLQHDRSNIESHVHKYDEKRPVYMTNFKEFPPMDEIGLKTSEPRESEGIWKTFRNSFRKKKNVVHSRAAFQPQGMRGQNPSSPPHRDRNREGRGELGECVVL